MPTLLQVDSSPLETSISRELTREFANAWKTNHPGGTVIHRDLAATPLKPLDGLWVSAAQTPVAARTGEQALALTLSDELIGELESADEYVIGVSMHNFGIPARLKLWIDEVVRGGRTFAYEATGPRGLLQGKKAIFLVASAGVYEAGTPLETWNHVDPYLTTVFNFLGVTNIQFVAAAGAAQLRTGAIDRETFLKPTLERVRTAAAA